MTYKIYFIERTRAQLCHSVHTTTDKSIMALITLRGDELGYEVRVETEE